MEKEYDILSSVQITQEMGRRYAEYRKRAKKMQKEVAEQSGVSVFTISGFERGTQTGISLSTFIKMLRAIGEVYQLEALLPELPESPAEVYYRTMKKTKK